MKSFFQSKKFIILSVALATLCGGIFFIENKASNEIEQRIIEQLTLIGADFDSVIVSPVAQSVEITKLSFVSEKENSIIDVFAEKIILDGISFDALDIDAGDYPLVAETVDLIDLKFSYKDPYTNFFVEVENYHISNWCQNIALLIEASEFGYASLEFLERAYTYKFDTYESGKVSSNTSYQNYLDTIFIECSLDSAISTWNDNDVILSSMQNFIMQLVNENDEIIECTVDQASIEMQIYKVFTPKLLALISHSYLTNSDNEVLDEMLLDTVLDEDFQQNMGKVLFDIKSLNLAYNEENIVSTALISTISDSATDSFKIDIKDLDFTNAFYKDFAEEFYSYLLDMKLEKTSLDYSLEANMLEDNMSINLKQELAIDDIFVLNIKAVIEMLYPLDEPIDENTPNKINELYLAYEDKGFIPRSNLVMQSLYNIDTQRALALQQESAQSFTHFIPDLSIATDKLFQDLGKVELNLNEGIGIFDMLFIPPASLNNLFDITYTPSNENIEDAIQKL